MRSSAFRLLNALKEKTSWNHSYIKPKYVSLIISKCVFFFGGGRLSFIDKQQNAYKQIFFATLRSRRTTTKRKCRKLETKQHKYKSLEFTNHILAGRIMSPLELHWISWQETTIRNSMCFSIQQRTPNVCERVTLKL